MLAATGAVVARFGDQMIVDLCIVLGMAVCGFLLVNFLRGLIFLGDGDAYLLGFLLVEIGILMVNPNPIVALWFVAAIAFQPTMETIFSIYRRRILDTRRFTAMLPDRLHLYSLVYHRRTALIFSRSWAERWVTKAAAAMAVVSFGALPIGLEVILPSSAFWNVVVVGGAILGYLIWFGSLVHFRGRTRYNLNRSAPAIRAS